MSSALEPESEPRDRAEAGSHTDWLQEVCGGAKSPAEMVKMCINRSWKILFCPYNEQKLMMSSRLDIITSHRHFKTFVFNPALTPRRNSENIQSMTLHHFLTVIVIFSHQLRS